MPYYIKKKKSSSKSKKSSTDYVKKLDAVFSKYIRLRDSMPNGMTKCISCGHIKPFSDMDCGHFFSRSRMATRWDERNCHAECAYCNRFRADHLHDYETNLKRMIGENEFNKLEMLAHSTRHWTETELKAMIDYYTRKAKLLSSEKGIKVK